MPNLGQIVDNAAAAQFDNFIADPARHLADDPVLLHNDQYVRTSFSLVSKTARLAEGTQTSNYRAPLLLALDFGDVLSSKTTLPSKKVCTQCICFKSSAGIV